MLTQRGSVDAAQARFPSQAPQPSLVPGGDGRPKGRLSPPLTVLSGPQRWGEH